ncbi:hypothetical protein SAMD00019534_093120 [Acytostelium subglobosum LB1]|uniref:hypothetical protein n=1 Tax=Acytostelium subglobosum LB1 TaxID=1410327 RepID=UPI0006449B2E|nr:hypothetical protein SAMD00019534_093120 [Acytostelium subglobosum LB1]GAM26137.1 hypothetical protein SAMD00019534_093120 [Acytostelium subglobosum LB1]|eukprot:XP_012750691.1 hypothetical protein SAMD00019534_093120 [Acytostelium subglobosum LB1]
MNFNRLAIVTFALLFLSFGLLIGSYLTYWTKVQVDNQLGPGVLTFYDSATEEKIVVVDGPNGDQERKSTSWENIYQTLSGQPINRLHERSIFRASLAFAIIAWIVELPILILIGLSIFNVFKNKKFRVGLCIRLLLGAAIALNIISVAIFSKIADYRNKDCVDAYDADNVRCTGPFYNHMIGSDDNTKVGLMPGYPCVISSTAFVIVSFIVSFFATFQIGNVQ